MEWYIRETEECRQFIVDQLDASFAGMRSGEHQPYGRPIDTTQRETDRLLSSLAEYDLVLADLRAALANR
jgi:hypothetical protein